MLSVSLQLNGAQTITPGATIDVSNVSGAPAGWQTEMSLVVNPTNPLNVVGFSHSINLPITLDVYVSSDGGLNWSTNQIDNADDGFGVAGSRFDPAIIFDASGTLYIMYGHRETNRTRLIAARSLDGGTSFGQFTFLDVQNDVGTSPGVDKWYLASGRDPVSGNQAVVGAYVVIATEGMNTDYRINVVGTNDGGITWTPPLEINDDSALLAVDDASYASPMIDNLGRLAVSWHDFNDSSIMIDRDFDGLWGNASLFFTDLTVRTGVDVDRDVDKPPAQPERGVNAAPMLEVWRATNFLYMPVVERYDGADLDIWVGRSTDFGESWIFNRIDESLGTEFNPWLQVDQTTGTVNVLYYTTDGDVNTGNDDVRPRIAMSNDGGVTWTRTFLSSQTSNETGGTANDYLEYIGLAVRDGTAHGLWSSRYAGGGNDLDAFTANAAFVSSTGDNRLFIGESGGADDNFLIRQSPANPAFLEVFVDGVREFTGLSATLDKIIINPGGGINIFNIGSLTGISSITINGTNNVDIYDIVSLGLGAPLSIVLGGDDDTVTLGSSPFASEVILSPVTVFGDGGNDTLFLGSNNGDSIDVNVTFNGGANVGGVGDRIVFNDTAPSYNISYDITPTFVTRDGINLPRTVSYSSTEGIVVNAGSGTDTVILRNAVAPLVTANGNNGNDNFIVGGGNMTGFVPQIFNGGLGTDQITFDDSLDPTNRIWDMRPDEVIFGGLISLFTSGFESVGLLAGTGHDEITFAGTLTQAFDIDGGGGNETFIIGFQTKAQFLAPVAIRGGSGNDNYQWTRGSNNWYQGIVDTNLYDVLLDGGTGYNTLAIDETTRSAAGYYLYADRFYATDGAVFPVGFDIDYDNMLAMSLTAGDGTTNVGIYGTSSDIDPGNQISIALAGGTDSVYLYPHDAQGNLTINGNVGIGGGAGTDSLYVDDSASSAPAVYSFANPFGAGTQNITGAGSAGFGIANDFEAITMTGSVGNDVYNINSYKSGMGLTINGGLGDDVCDFGNGDVAANVTSIASFLFNGMEGTDTFNLRNANPANSFTYTAAANTTLQVSRTFPSSYFVSLEYYNTEQKAVYAGPAVDIMNITSFASGELSFHGAGGDDALNLPTSSDLLGRRVNFFGDAGAANRINQVTNSKTAPSTLHVAQNTIGAFPGDNFFAPGGSVFVDSVQIIQLRMGSGADTAYMQPDAVAAISIIGGNPTTAPGDTLNLGLASAANYVVNGSPANGNVTSSNLQTLTYSGFETGPIVDAVAPTANIVDVSPDPRTTSVASILIDFTEAVTGFNLADLTLTSNGGANLLPASATLTSGNQLNWTLGNLAGLTLTSGAYLLTLNVAGSGIADLFGNAMLVGASDAWTADIPPLMGDANGDNIVDIFDVNLVSAHWGEMGPLGDVNHDGIVDIFDVNLISANWGQVPGGGGGGGVAESSLRGQPSAVSEPTAIATIASPVADPPKPRLLEMIASPMGRTQHPSGHDANPRLEWTALGRHFGGVVPSAGLADLSRAALDAAIGSVVASQRPHVATSLQTSMPNLLGQQIRTAALTKASNAGATDALFRDENFESLLDGVGVDHRVRTRWAEFAG